MPNNSAALTCRIYVFFCLHDYFYCPMKDILVLSFYVCSQPSHYFDIAAISEA